MSSILTLFSLPGQVAAIVKAINDIRGLSSVVAQVEADPKLGDYYTFIEDAVHNLEIDLAAFHTGHVWQWFADAEKLASDASALSVHAMALVESAPALPEQSPLLSKYVSDLYNAAKAVAGLLSNFGIVVPVPALPFAIPSAAAPAPVEDPYKPVALSVPTSTPTPQAPAPQPLADNVADAGGDPLTSPLASDALS
jgi:hypothetical protein